MKRSGTITIHDTHVGIWDDTVDDANALRVMHALLEAMAARGFHVGLDPNVKPLIARFYAVGRRGDLGFRTEACGCHIAVTFFQDLVVENRNGGRYDVRKLDRMAAHLSHLRLACVAAMTVVTQVALDLGYKLAEEHTPAGALALTVRDAAEGRSDRKAWSTGDPGVQCDRDGCALKNGHERYVRHRGRLMRGTIQHHISNRWRVDFGGEVTFVNADDLFWTARPDQERRRLVPGHEKRLKRELDKAAGQSAWRRVAVLARELEPQAAAQRRAT